VALADAADRRVAAHLPQRLDVVGEQQRLAAHAGGGQGGLGAGMAATNDDDVECLLDRAWVAPWDAGAAFANGAVILRRDAIPRASEHSLALHPAWP
jgi:hypothetical protein